MDERHVVVVDDVGLAELALSDHTLYAVCTRAELWAAIDGYGQCRYDDGFADNDGGFGWTKMEAHACLEKRRHIRSLLGMEAEQ